MGLVTPNSNLAYLAQAPHSALKEVTTVAEWICRYIMAGLLLVPLFMPR